MKTNSEKPPVFKNWGYWYALTFMILVIQIALYFYFTEKYK